MDGIKVKQNVNNIYFEPLSDTKEQNKLNMIFIGLSYITVRSCSSTFCQAINLLSKQARQDERKKERKKESQVLFVLCYPIWIYISSQTDFGLEFLCARILTMAGHHRCQ